MDTAVQTLPDITTPRLLPPPPPANCSHVALSGALAHLRSGLGRSTQSQMEHDTWTAEAGDALRKFDSAISELIAHRNRSEVAGEIIAGLHDRIRELTFKLDNFGAVELTPAGQAAVANVAVAPSVPLVDRCGTGLQPVSGFSPVTGAPRLSDVPFVTEDDDEALTDVPPNLDGTLGRSSTPSNPSHSSPPSSADSAETIADLHDRMGDYTHVLSYARDQLKTLADHAGMFETQGLRRQLNSLRDVLGKAIGF